jgi:hypothetical protein
MEKNGYNGGDLTKSLIASQDKQIGGLVGACENLHLECGSNCARSSEGPGISSFSYQSRSLKELPLFKFSAAMLYIDKSSSAPPLLVQRLTG